MPRKPPPIKERKLPSGLSPSSMDLYHQCPRRFEIQKIQGGYEPAGEPALLGTFVHRILELLMEADPKGRTIDFAQDCARIAWPEIKEEADFQLLELSEKDQKAFRWSAWGSVLNYFEMEDPQSVEVEATEGKMDVVVEGVPMRGIIDRLDREPDGLVVSDYKNGKVPEKRYRGPKLTQLNFYAVMLEHMRGERPKRGRLIFTAHKEILDTRITDHSAQELVAKVKDTWSSIDRAFHHDGFPPRTGPLCGWCPAVATCPEGLAEVRMRYLKGTLKQSAPAYSLASVSVSSRS